MLEIKNISKTYRKSNVKAIDNVSLTIVEGDIFGFIGPNGSGKSTTIKCITGIHSYDEGEIIFDGISIKDKPLLAKQKMAYVPDNPDVYETLTGIDYINFVFCSSGWIVLIYILRKIQHKTFPVSLSLSAGR